MPYDPKVGDRVVLRGVVDRIGGNYVGLKTISTDNYYACIADLELDTSPPPPKPLEVGCMARRVGDATDAVKVLWMDGYYALVRFVPGPTTPFIRYRKDLERVDA